MDFFEQQAKAKRNTALLVFYFLLAIVLIIIAINAIVALSLWYTHLHKEAVYVGGLQPLGDEKLDLTLLVFSYVTPVIVVIILFGTLLKMIVLRHGGLSVAKMVGATKIAPDTKHPLQRRFLNVVEEMSIASGVRIPHLFVMNNENGINAFVAGNKPEDTVMVVTKGALKQLNRSELQGVVGHEFSHIFNNDMQINLRLMCLLGGLLVIGQTGYFMIRSMTRGRRSRSKGDGRVVLAILGIGAGLFVVGYIGLFFGRLIKSAVSRQRELLADSCAIQYSRNPTGLVGALMRIKESQSGTFLNSKNTEDVSHMCFCPSVAMLFGGLLDTHPPLEFRIQRLDPDRQYRRRQVRKKKKVEKPKQDKKPSLGPLLIPILAGAAIQSDMSQVKKSIGEPTNAHIEFAHALLRKTPRSLLLLARTPKEVLNLLFAMAITQNPPPLKKIAQILSIKDKASLKKLLAISKKLRDSPRAIWLPLIDIALPAFKANSMAVREKTLKDLQSLLCLTPLTSYQFVLNAMLSKATETSSSGKPKKYQNKEETLKDVGQLLAIILLEANAFTEKKATYNKAMSLFSHTFPEFPEDNLPTLNHFQGLLARLNALPPLLKKKIIDAAFICIEENETISSVEAELVRGIAICLDCPIPPLLPTFEPQEEPGKL